ncbi:hypothetical protein VPNG_09617 [Cytospora leucostoma]|uniref:Uncharacterized protein n=1 Tax=Cytospora leucostoma TaxID=1230097 RepID=A0A423VQZ8_9PEZI|nr:hypothetical protein VPNG_09617 [Cytospora leucostoma]
METIYFSGVQLENPTTPLKILTNHRTAVDQKLTGEVFNIIKARRDRDPVQFEMSSCGKALQHRYVSDAGINFASGLAWGRRASHLVPPTRSRMGIHNVMMS